MAIFTDIADFRQHAPQLHLNYNWDRLARTINQVIRQRIWPYISETEYLVLEAGYLAGDGGAFSHAFSAAYNSSPALDAVQEKAVEFLQDAIAHFTVLHLLSVNRVQIAEMGIQQNNSSDGTSSPASYHAIQDTKDIIAGMAYEFMDAALAYMEDNQASFPDWVASDAYTEIKEIFVWNTGILNRYVSAGMSRHTFLSLRAQLVQVQENQIRAQIGDTLTDALLAALKGNTLTFDQAKLVQYLQAWQAPAAAASAIPFFRVEMHDGGIYFRSQADGPNSRRAANSDIINRGAVGEMQAHLWSLAEAAKGSCLRYLQDNLSTFPDYEGIETDFFTDGDPTFQLPDNAFRRSFRT